MQWPNKKDKGAHNDLQNNTRKTKDRATRKQKTGEELDDYEKFHFVVNRASSVCPLSLKSSARKPLNKTWQICSFTKLVRFGEQSYYTIINLFWLAEKVKTIYPMNSLSSWNQINDKNVYCKIFTKCFTLVPISQPISPTVRSFVYHWCQYEILKKIF